MNKCVQFLETVLNQDGKVSFRKGDFCRVISEGKEFLSVEGSETSDTGICNFPKSEIDKIFVVYETTQNGC